MSRGVSSMRWPMPPLIRAVLSGNDVWWPCLRPSLSPAQTSDAAFADRDLDAPTILLQRRSAVAFDGASFMDRVPFLRMLLRVMPGPGAPWDALWWSPRIHLALFVHRVIGIAPGLYLLA